MSDLSADQMLDIALRQGKVQVAQFIRDMEEAELEVQYYRGRFSWRGPAVDTDDRQEIIRATRSGSSGTIWARAGLSIRFKGWMKKTNRGQHDPEGVSGEANFGEQRSMKTKDPSPVIGLMQSVWSNACKATGHSWERINHAMRQALELALGAGYEFTAEDFAALSEFSVGRWIGASSEWVYSQAIAEGNQSAAVAFEGWQEREPVIADEVTPASHRGFCHMAGDRQRERLHVGCSMKWKGERVKVTSFGKDGSVTACVYHPGKTDDRGYAVDYESKIKKRYRITREAIIEDRAERKERKQLEEELHVCVQAGKCEVADIIAELGITTRTEYDVHSVAKIRAVLEKLKAGLPIAKAKARATRKRKVG